MSTWEQEEQDTIFRMSTVELKDTLAFMQQRVDALKQEVERRTIQENKS